METKFEVINCSYKDTDSTDLIFGIRHRVFVEEQRVSREEEFDQFEATSVHYLGYYEGKPAATARWRVTENGIKLERFAVEKLLRGKGAGWAVLMRVLEDVSAIGLTVYLNAQITAIGFYEKAGFKKEGPMFSEANIDHYKMVYHR